MAMSQQEIIKKFMASLDNTTLSGTAAVDEAIRACSNFDSMQEVKNKMIEDCTNAKNADDFLKNYCGINLDNEDTGAITGADAGGNTIITEESTIPESGNIDETFNKNSFTVNGLTVKLTDTDNNEINFSDLNDSQKFIWQWLHTFGIKGALDLISDSYGENFSFTNKSSATVKVLKVAFVENSSNVAETYRWSRNNSDETTDLRLQINMSSWDSLTLDIANKDIDRVIAHELTHAVMAANLKLTTYVNLPKFIREGFAELTIGIDNTRVFQNTNTSKIKYLAENVSELQQSLNDTDGDIYAGGYMFLRYLARQSADLDISNSNSNNLVSTFYGNDTILNTASNVTIKTNEGNDSIKNLGSKVTIDGGAGNDFIRNWDWDTTNNVKIIGNAGNDTIANVGSYVTILGGAGSDSIHNWASNAYIEGGADNDIIISDSYYSLSNNVTINGGAGNDRINISEGKNNVVVYNNGDGTDTVYGLNSDDTLKIIGAEYSTTRSGSDLIFSVGSGKIIAKNGLNSNFKVIGPQPNPSSVIFNNAKESLATAATITADYEEETFEAADYGKLKTIDASEATVEEFTIIGNKQANKIIGSEGNDCINGGKGTDTVTGGDGNDTFVYEYGDGNLIITDYTEGEDKIEIQGEDVETVINSATVKSGDVIFKIGSGKITVKGGKDQEITFNDEDGEEYYYSGSNAKTLDLLYDNNFMNDDTKLDSITEQKFEVQNIETQNYNNLAQEDKTFITYTEK